MKRFAIALVLIGCSKRLQEIAIAKAIARPAYFSPARRFMYSRRICWNSSGYSSMSRRPCIIASRIPGGRSPHRRVRSPRDWNLFGPSTRLGS